MKVLSFVFLLIFAVGISAQTPSAERLYSEAAQHVSDGRFDTALTSYKAALAAAESRYAAKDYRALLRYNIGVCYFHLDRFELAAKEFKSALLLKTDYARAYAALEIAEKQSRKASRDLHAAVSQTVAGN